MDEKQPIVNRRRHKKSRKEDYMQKFGISLVVTVFMGLFGWQATSQSISNEITRELLKGQSTTNERLKNQIDGFKEQKTETKQGFREINGRMDKIELKLESVRDEVSLIKLISSITNPKKNKNK